MKQYRGRFNSRFFAAAITATVSLLGIHSAQSVDARHQPAVQLEGRLAPTPDQLLYSFVEAKGVNDGPGSGLVRDAAGNLYGTTDSNGDDVAGNVFVLSPQLGGGWKETALYNFSFKGGDGSKPNGLVLDPSGNLYGTTAYGGNGNCVIDGFSGCGIVFELSPRSGGNWKETILYNFQNDGMDGHAPTGSLIFDMAGNLYGTTEAGGTGACTSEGCGTVFELSPKSGGGWTERGLYSFQNNGVGGLYPFSGVAFDAVGNLYGTTGGGGSFSGNSCLLYAGCGTVFELSPVSGGWSEAVIHDFQENGQDGYFPLAGVTFDATGNLYGTTVGGGVGDAGTVFELSAKSGDGWKEKILHSFQNNGKDGMGPLAGLTIDTAGTLYGNTNQGGSNICAGNLGCGTVFELSPRSGGGWKETVIHNFGSGLGDGHGPAGVLVLDPSGNLYGVAETGGAYDGGAVYTLAP